MNSITATAIAARQSGQAANNWHIGVIWARCRRKLADLGTLLGDLIVQTQAEDACLVGTTLTIAAALALSAHSPS